MRVRSITTRGSFDEPGIVVNGVRQRTAAGGTADPEKLRLRWIFANVGCTTCGLPQAKIDREFRDRICQVRLPDSVADVSDKDSSGLRAKEPFWFATAPMFESTI